MAERQLHGGPIGNSKGYGHRAQGRAGVLRGILEWELTRGRPGTQVRRNAPRFYSDAAVEPPHPRTASHPPTAEEGPLLHGGGGPGPRNAQPRPCGGSPPPVCGDTSLPHPTSPDRTGVLALPGLA